MINDSFGRPWRNGVVGVALGAAGLPSLLSLIGAPDLFGRAMRVTEVAFADEIAAAASMLMGQADERLPLVHVRGLALGRAGTQPLSATQGWTCSGRVRTSIRVHGIGLRNRT